MKELAKRTRGKGISQEEIYDKMSFEEQQLTFNVQGEPIFIISNLLATLLYNWNHKEEIRKYKQEIKEQEDKIINEMKSGNIDSFYNFQYQGDTFKERLHIVSETKVRRSIRKFLKNN